VAQSAILKIDIVSDARKSKAGFKEASRDLDKLGRDADRNSKTFATSTGRMTSSMKGAALGIKAGVAGIVGMLGGQLIGSTVNAAVGFEQMNKKISTVFGDSEKDVRAWAKTVSSQMGTSSQEVAGMAAAMADLLKPMGMTTRQAADMSKEMVGISAALSAWSGGQRSAAEVTDILSGALLGEYDALKGLGISLDAAEVKERALQIAKKNGKKAVDDISTAMAVQQLVTEKSGDALKAYGEDTDGLAPKVNELKAAFAEFRVKALELLTPVLIEITEWMTDKALPAFVRFVDWVKLNWPKIVAVVKTMSAALLNISALALDLGAVFLRVIAMIIPAWSKWVSFTLSGVATISDALAGVIGIFNKDMAASLRNTADNTRSMSKVFAENGPMWADQARSAADALAGAAEQARRTAQNVASIKTNVPITITYREVGGAVARRGSGGYMTEFDQPFPSTTVNVVIPPQPTPTITVNGALDPVAVADQIRGILRKTGRMVAHA
jgi:hypothetical protein